MQRLALRYLILVMKIQALSSWVDQLTLELKPITMVLELNLRQAETAGIKSKQSKLSVNVDTGASFGSDGVEAKAAGFGFKVRK